MFLYIAIRVFCRGNFQTIRTTPLGARADDGRAAREPLDLNQQLLCNNNNDNAVGDNIKLLLILITSICK